MQISDREKEMLKAMIDNDQPLPPKYRLSLFADAPEVELIWQGKTSEVTNVVLPFQSIEQIDEPRSELVAGYQINMFGLDAQGRQQEGWTNKLIWGDNKLVLSSLKNGPLRREIEAAGGLNLIYIDPPFDVGADFSFDVQVGDAEAVTREQSVIETVAYNDTWESGTDSYLSMIFERLLAMKSLLNPGGSIFVHCDWRLSGAIRMLLNEIFDSTNFLNELIWVYGASARGAKAISTQFPRNHDSIYWYRNSKGHLFNGDAMERIFSPAEARVAGFRIDDEGRWFKTAPRGDYTDESVQRLEAEGRIFRTASGGVRIKYFLELRGDKVVERLPVGDAWMDIPDAMHLPDVEQTGYATQKPEALLKRIISSTTKEGDLVADFFCGSGTTLAAAEKLGRRWIGSDLGRFAVHTSRKRLIGVQRQLKAEGKPYRAFEILNLGKYERQFFVGIDPTLPDDERIAQAVQREEQYLSLILGAYKAERVESLPHVQGRKGSTLVYVGSIDAPVTLAEVADIVTTCQKRGWSKVDILAFEYEMGLNPYMQDEARAKGVNLGLKYIPKDVFDKRAIERNQVQFYNAAYLDAQPTVSGRSATVTLSDFGVFYGQDEGPEIAEKLKPGGNRVSVVNGQVVRVSKDKAGAVTEERLTKLWTDWIDYWAVDFEFGSKPEFVRLVDHERTEREVRTGNFIFENEWQSFRTRRDRKLELTSASHTYPAPGRYKIAVKVIDIFGNDTTKVVPVEVG